MDLSSPGPNTETGTLLTAEPKVVLTLPRAETSISQSPLNQTSSGSLHAIAHNDQGSSDSDVVRLRLECITDGQMKVCGNIRSLHVTIPIILRFHHQFS